MNEIWKTTERLKGFYEVSSLGRIRRVAKGPHTHVGKILKLHLGKGRYLKTTLFAPTFRRWTINIHQLVCEAFHGPCPPQTEANHLNCNSLDNREDNLAWLPHVENMRASAGAVRKGMRRACAKVTEQDVTDIRSALARGDGAESLAEKYKIGCAAVSKIKTRRTWKEIA